MCILTVRVCGFCQVFKSVISPKTLKDQSFNLPDEKTLQYMPTIAQLARDRAGPPGCVSTMWGGGRNTAASSSHRQAHEPAAKQWPLRFLDKSCAGPFKMVCFLFFFFLISQVQGM